MRVCDQKVWSCVVVLMLLSAGGCHSSKALWGPASAVGGAAVGAAISSALSDHAWAPAGGALAGGIVGAGTYYIGKSAEEEEYASGYEQGLSDSIKRQYWIQARMQKVLRAEKE